MYGSTMDEDITVMKGLTDIQKKQIQQYDKQQYARGQLHWCQLNLSVN